MPGTSPIPKSLRDGYNSVVKRKRPANALQFLNVDLIRNIVFTLFVLRWTRRAYWKLKGRGPIGTLQELYADTKRILFGWFLRVPMVRTKTRKDVAEGLAKVEKELIKPHLTRYLSLPEAGWTSDAVRAEVEALANLDHTKWEEGYVSGAVYHGEEDLLKLQTETYGKFTVANPIHPDVFPGVRKMEAEVVAMVLSLFNAPKDAAGVTTSGGSESILMAVLSAKNKARAERGVTEPELIIPSTAHTAFRKAAQYFGIKLQLVACPAPSYQVDVAKMARLINSNTIMLVGSAPNFPHGVIDDISALSKLALRRKLPLHVDCCLGSFLVPFLDKAGFETAPFDFRLKGVTSISVDTHKYGFAPKGNSTVLYRTAELRKYQYFVVADWSGGVYVSPGVAGSRPGALIAACWASMMNVGQAGYLKACKEIVGAAKEFADYLTVSPILSSELELIGNPLVSVIAFRARNLDIYAMNDAMTKKGWHLNALQDPPALHIAFTLPSARVWQKLASDLEAVIEDEREKERARIANGEPAKGKNVGSTVALYGVAGSFPNKGIVVELASGFLDIMFKA